MGLQDFAMNMLKQKVMDTISGHAQDQAHTGFDPTALMGQVQGVMNSPGANSGNMGSMLTSLISSHAQDQAHTGFDPTALLGQVQGLADQHQQYAGNPQFNAAPSSEDPYGDPSDQYANAAPSSEDSYGDPSDETANAAPSSEDPDGDPSNQR